MSTINVNRMADSQGGVLAPISSVMRNRILNGSFTIDQRNAGASVTPTGSAYTLDRWQLSIAAASKLSVQQSSTAPTGFRNSVLITSTSAYTPSAGDYMSFCQKVEGFNFSDFMWGTASAVTVNLSFWVRSSLTGTFSGALQNDGASRSYPFTFTISAANTFEYKTVTIAGDTSGSWNTTTGKGVEVHFNMGSGSDRLGTAGAWNSNWNTGATGSVALVSTNGATFFITGVQLEKGTQATSFEYRQYGQELALCQRYYVEFPASSQMAAYTSSATEIVGTVNLPVQLRATPSVTSAGGNKYGWYDTNYNSSSSNTVSMATTGSLATYTISQAGFGSLTTLRSRVLQSDSAYKFSAEL